MGLADRAVVVSSRAIRLLAPWGVRIGGVLWRRIGVEASVGVRLSSLGACEHVKWRSAAGEVLIQVL